MLASTAAASPCIDDGRVCTAIDDDAVTYPDGHRVRDVDVGTTGEPKPILHTHSAYFELLDRVLGPLRGERPRSVARRARRPT